MRSSIDTCKRRFMYYLCTINNETNKTTMNTQAIQIKTLNRVDVPAEYQKEEGCIAFQKVEITFGFYSAKRTQIYDTKILENGKQVIIGGDGFVKDGFIIN